MAFSKDEESNYEDPSTYKKVPRPISKVMDDVFLPELQNTQMINNVIIGMK